jgi:hypothetical protein
MADENLSVGDAYAYQVLNKWLALIDVSERFRGALLSFDEKEQQLPADAVEVLNEYVARITRLWEELAPVIKDRKDLGDLPARFGRFSIYYYNPRRLTEKDNVEDLFKMEEVIREALHKTKITQYEKV